MASLCSVTPLRLALALAACGQAAAQADAPLPPAVTGEEELVCDPQGSLSACAVCTVDVGQAITSLGLAGVSVRDAVKACDKDFDPTGDVSQLRWTSDERAACSAAINNVLSLFLFVASYLSAASANCARTLNVEGYCSADITNLLGDLATVAAAASTAQISCDGEYDIRKPPPTKQEYKDELIREAKINAAAHSHRVLLASNDTEEDRRLLEEAKLPPNPASFPYLNERAMSTKESYQKVKSWMVDVNSRRTELAACSFNVIQVVLYTMRASLSISAAARNCNSQVFGGEGTPGQMTCSVDIAGIIGSFSWAATAVAYSVTQCPTGSNFDAVCAANILAMVASVAGVAQSGLSFLLTCGEMGQEGRRLQMASEVNSSSPVHV